MEKSNVKLVTYTIKYLSFGGQVLKTVEYPYKTRLLAATRETNPACIVAHIQGLHQQGGMPGGVASGFKGMIEIESKAERIRHKLIFRG